MNRKCFVVMPFASSFDGIWNYVIKSTVEQAKDECIRADNIFAPGSIIKDLFELIRESDYLIADLTGQNPNVYYELGIAHALEKPVILIIQDMSELPFDLMDKRVIQYSDTARGAEDLRIALLKYINNIV